MAVSVGEFVGSGRFVPKRVWSCSLHERDTTFDEMWDSPGEVCLECVTGCWRDLKDPEGVVVLRELSNWEAMLHDAFVRSPLEGMSLFGPKRIDWLEDELLPRSAA